MKRDWDFETLQYDWRIESRPDGFYIIESTKRVPGRIEYGPIPTAEIGIELITERKREVRNLAAKFLARLSPGSDRRE